MRLRRLGLGALALAVGYPVVLTATRRWHRHWGATDEEVARTLPGDDLIPAARLDSTHAITIHAPAERIWPWLAQVGYAGRAGFYSYGVLERLFGARDTDRLNPDTPPPAVGEELPFAPGMPMTVAVVDPPRALVLWQVTSAGRAIDPTGPWGDDHVAWSWAFVLDQVEAGTTRLLTRMRVDYRPAARQAPFVHLLLEPAHFVMGRRQLLGIRQRAEAGEPTARSYSSGTTIHRSPEDVFDHCSDLRNELEWNPDVRYVHKLTDGPVGVGTRYRARWANSGETTVEVVEFQRPRTWQTHAHARGMDVRTRGTVTPAASGARYVVHLELRAEGAARVLARLALVAMRRREQQNLRRIKQALESSGAAPARTRDSGPGGGGP